MIKCKGSKKLRIIIIIVIAVAFFSKCIDTADKDKQVNIVNNSGEQFAGSAACANCHREIFDHFTHTAHSFTSQPASEETIKGSFARGENLFSYSYYSKVGMEKRDSGLYQVEYDKNFTEKGSFRFDIVIGSGTRGQSYLYRKDKSLFQLPVSYFTMADTWSNSPGYPMYNPDFSRPVTFRCLECHSTYFKTLSGNTQIRAEKFDSRQAIYGVQCESCHGPAKKHVDFHEQNTHETQGKYIINPSSFNRQQQIDLCAYCHGGTRRSDKEPFSFVPGDTLSFADQPANTALNTENIEVHDNQYALLKASKCFRMSKIMSCNTCHNTHEQERGDLALFSKKCMSCHSIEKNNFCKMAPSLGAGIVKNCIDCHMPQKPSKMLTIQLENESNNTPSTLRSHIIAVYPSETKKYLSVNHLLTGKN